MNEFQGKTAAVIGLARAGVPAARFLAERGAKVIGYDGKAREALSAEALELESLGAQLVTGGHGFAGIEACELVVLSPGLKVHYEPLQSVIAAAEARGAEVIGELELASRFCPCPIIGITGTKGKSTTTKLIAEMLRACGIDAHAAGNTGTPLISILPTLSADSWAVVEVSSFQLEKAPTLRPKIAVLLSLLEDHQDYHPTLEQYWETKLKIFDNLREGDSAVLNMDDERVAQWAIQETNDRLDGTNSHQWRGVTTSGLDYRAAGNGEDAVYFRDGQLVTEVPLGQIVPLLSANEIPLQGQHNRANVAAAVAAALFAAGDKFDVVKVADAIRHFETLPHRLEIVARKDGITWVNDSQSTIPDAAIAALKSFPAPVTLLVGGRAKIEASGYEALMRAVKAEKARLILFGEAAPMLKEVALSTNVENSSIFMENTLAGALRTARIQSSNGESVILSPACASFDQFNSYEHRGETFRQLVLEI